MLDSENNQLFQALRQFAGPGNFRSLQSQEVSRRTEEAETPVLVLNPSKTVSTDLVRRGYTNTHRFLALPSHSAPRWLLPLGNLHWTISGAEIYAPYARKARMMKGLLTALIRTGWSGWTRDRVLITSREPLPINALVTEVTGERHPVFALSLGNRIAIRKLTVQVMRPDGEVLGYIKLPLTSSAIDRIRHESSTLERLSNFPALRPNIPRLLYAGEWGEGWILFQSPLRGKLGPADFTRMHADFLRTLWNAHQVEKPGRSLAEQVGRKWETTSCSLGSEWERLAREVLRRSARDLEQLTVRCGISHGDFAPWNTRVQGGRLLSFDWESTNWEAPRSWDIFHFDLQTKMSLKRHIQHSFPPDSNVIRQNSYLLYLLSSVIRFFQEGNWAAIAYCRELLVRQLAETANMGSERFYAHPS